MRLNPENEAGPPSDLENNSNIAEKSGAEGEDESRVVDGIWPSLDVAETTV